jgi:hypothetical protein
MRPFLADFAPILEKVAPLRGTAGFDDVYVEVNDWVLSARTPSQAHATCQRIATMCHPRAWGDRGLSSAEMQSWAAFLGELKALSLRTAERLE